MSSEFVQNVLIRVRSDGSIEVTKLGEQFKNLGQQAAGARGGVNQFSEALGRFGSQLAVWTAGLMTMQKAIQAVREGMRHFDEVQTLTAGIASMTGSWDRAREAMDYFERASKTTRSTASELARMYRDILPLALRAGFDPGVMQRFTVQLSQVATATGHTAEGLTDAFRLMLTGHVRASNELLTALGFRVEDLTKAGSTKIREMAETFVRKAQEGAAMGESFASTAKKVGDAWGDAFARGIAGVSGTSAALGVMKKDLTDPTILASVESIGESFRRMLPGVTSVVAEILKLLAAVSTIPGGALDFLMFLMGARPVGQKPLNLSDWPLKGQKQGPLTLGTGAGKVAEGKEGTLIGLTEEEARLVSWEAKVKEIQRLFETTGKLTREGMGTQWVSDVTKVNQAVKDLLKNIQMTAKETGSAEYAMQAYAQQVFDIAGEYMRVHKAFPEDLKAAYNVAVQYLARQAEIIDADKAQKEAVEALAKAVEDQGKAEVALLDKTMKLRTQATATIIEQVDQLRFALSQIPGAAPQEEALARLQANAIAALANQEVLGTETVQAILDALTSGGKILYANTKKGAEEFMRVFSQFEALVITPLKATLHDVFVTGGKNLGQLAGQAFSNAVAAGIEWILKPLVGEPTQDPKTGMWMSRSGKPFQTREQAQQMNLLSKMGKGGSIAGLAAISGLGGYYSGASDLSTILSGAIGGYGIGMSLTSILGASAGWIGLIVGAVASGIGKLLQSSVGSDYSYGIPHLTGPQKAPPSYSQWSDFEKFGIWSPGLGITWTGVQNIPQARLKEMNAQIRQQFEDFWGGYLKILISVGSKMIPKMSEWKYDPLRGDVNAGAQFSKEASKSYWGHWDQWVSGTLPRELAKVFYDPLEAAFQSYGGTAERFKALWTEFDQLDPKKALELWTKFFNTLKDLSKAMTYFGTPFGFRADPFGRGGMFDTTSLWNQGVQDKYKSFGSTIADIDKQIFDLADELGNMTNQQQVEAMAEINGLVQQRYEAERNYIRQLIDMIEDANRTFQQNIEEYKTATMTPAERYAYYQQEVERHRQTIGTARTPEEAMQAWSDLQADMPKLIQAGLDAGVKAADIYASATGFITTVHDELIQKLIDFGTSIDQMNQTFTEKFTPIWDEWMGKLTDSGDGLDNLSRSAADAGVKLSDFTTELSSATGAVVEFRRALSAPGASAQSGAGTSDFPSYVRSRRLGA